MTNKIFSLGSDCYIAGSLRSTFNYSSLFDWFQSQRLSGIVEFLEEGITDPFGEGCHIYDEGRKDLYNTKFNFRLPHEPELFHEDEKHRQLAHDRWARRHERWYNNKKQDDLYIFIRKVYAHPYDVIFENGVIVGPSHEVMGENIQQNYSKDVYDRLQQHLPKNNKIIVLFPHEIIHRLPEDKRSEVVNSIYDGFIVQNLVEIYPDFKPTDNCNTHTDLWFKDHLVPSQLDMDRVYNNRHLNG